MSAYLRVRIPIWLDRICALPILLYRRLKYDYPYRKIYLGEGKFTIADTEDYYRFNYFNWCPRKTAKISTPFDSSARQKTELKSFPCTVLSLIPLNAFWSTTETVSASITERKTSASPHTPRTSSIKERPGKILPRATSAYSLKINPENGSPESSITKKEPGSADSNPKSTPLAPMIRTPKNITANLHD